MSTTARSTVSSVLIPTFNRGEMLLEAVDSVLGQSVAPHQVIVIDDGSTDGTSECLTRYGTRVECIRKEQRRQVERPEPWPGTRVTGDLVWVFDDDDVALPGSIADRLNVLRISPTVALSFPPSLGRESASGAIEVRSVSGHWPPVDTSNVILTLMKGCFTTLQGALVRTACYRTVGPFREDLLRSQDYDMLLRLVRRFPVAFLDRPTYIARRHGGVRGPVAVRHAAADREQIWARYDGLLGKHLRREAVLGDFLCPRAVGALSQEQTRLALLNRMSVMASKGLAAEMIEDAAAFVRLEPTPRRRVGWRRPSTQSPRRPFSIVTSCLRSCRVLPSSSRLRGFLRGSSVGRDLLRAYARGLLGLAKWGTTSMRDRVRIVRLAAGLAMLSYGARGDSLVTRCSFEADTSGRRTQVGGGPVSATPTAAQYWAQRPLGTQVRSHHRARIRT